MAYGACLCITSMIVFGVLAFYVIVAVIISYVNYGEQDIVIAEGDNVLLTEGFDNTFCDKVKIWNSKVDFNAYRMPQLERNLTHQKEKVKHEMYLRSHDYDFIQFHLMQRSYVTIRGCTQGSFISAFVVKGEENMNKFQENLDTHNEDWSQIENYVWPTKVGYIYTCDSEVKDCTCYGHSGEIYTSPWTTYNINIDEDDNYYFVFWYTGKKCLYGNCEVIGDDFVTVLLDITVERTSYMRSNIHCQKMASCYIGLDFTYKDYLYVDTPHNEQYSTLRLNSRCSMRLGMLIGLFALLVVATSGVGILIMLCVVKCKNREESETFT